VTVVLSSLGIFLGILLFKSFRLYQNTETKKEEIRRGAIENQEIMKLKLLEKNYQNLINQQRFKLKKMRRDYDIDFDDEELDGLEYDEEKENSLDLSELAKTIYPKLPPSIANLLDKEEFQTAILKTIEKKPDIINMFIDKFMKKDSQVSDHKVNQLQEAYL